MKIQTSHFARIIALAAVAGLCLAAPAGNAATYTWTGADNTGWATAANWSSSGFPISGSTNTNLGLVLHSRSSAYVTKNNVSGSLYLNSLEFGTGTGSEAVTLTVSAGAAALTFVNDGVTTPRLVQNSHANFLINGAGVVGVGGMVLQDNLTISGTGTGLVNISTIVSGTGGLIVNSAGAVTLAGVNTFSGGVTLNSGTLQLGTGSATILGSGTLLLNGGRVSSVSTTAKVTAVPVQLGAGSTVHLGSTVNAGALTFNGAANFGNGASLVADSNVTFGGAITSGGNITLAPRNNAVLTLSGLDVAGGVTLELALGSNALVVTGALGNSDNSRFTFDLSGGVIGEVYTLVKFGSTTLNVSDLQLAVGSSLIDQSFGNGGWLIQDGQLQVRAIPEPSTLGMALLGLLALGLFTRSRKAGAVL